jgi:membrane protein
MAKDGALRKSAAAAAVVLLGMAALRKAGAINGKAEVRTATARRHRSGGDRHGPDGPTDIGPAGWMDALWGTYQATNQDRIFLVAAGITFYGLLALFPALTALVSIAGFFVDPNRAVEQLQSFSSFLPEGAVGIIGGQMERIASQSKNSLSIAFLVGLAIALWTANNGIKAIFDGLNVVYDEREDRSFVRLTLVSFLFTLGAIATIILALGAIVVVPVILAFLGLEGVTGTLIDLGRWPLLVALIVVGIGLLYRFGPSRRPPRWRWISAGSLLAALIWVGASALFSWYVANFNSYNETYGSLGAVIAFMVWMWISTSIVLLGAEFNATLENRAAGDTAESPSQSDDHRESRMSDAVGQPAGE